VPQSLNIDPSLIQIIYAERAHWVYIPDHDRTMTSTRQQQAKLAKPKHKGSWKSLKDKGWQDQGKGQE